MTSPAPVDELIDESPLIMFAGELSADRLAAGKPLFVATYVSPNVERILGYRVEDLLDDQHSWIAHIHPDDRDRIAERWLAICRNPLEDLKTECWIRTSDGTYRWFQISATRSAASPEHVLVYLVDVTDRFAADRAVRESEARLHAILNNSASAICVKDRTGRYLTVNQAAIDSMGRTRAEIIGKTDHDLFGTSAAQVRANDLMVLETSAAAAFEETMMQADGLHHVLSVKSPLIDPAGRTYAVCGVSTDITDRERDRALLALAKREAEDARADAEKASLAKTEFLSRMSHELRTPLNAVIGFSRILELDDLADSQRECVEQIARAGHHLLDLINEVLDIGRIEAGKLELAIESVLIDEVVLTAAGLLHPLAAKEGIVIESFSNTARSTYVRADRQRLLQVVINLVANAVKYNKANGHVSISYELEGDDRVRVSVEDTGVGIREENHAQVFTPFERFEAEHTTVEGTGVGLSISQSLIEQMGGHLEFTSTVGVGSTFSFDLAVGERPTATPAATPSAEPLRPGRSELPNPSGDTEGTPAFTVLYIEDNALNVHLIARALKLRHRAKLVSAELGADGLALADEHLPDLILLDLHLPDCNGHEVLVALRANPRTRLIPVVVLSADAPGNHEEQLRAEGADRYLMKPINLDEMLCVIDDLVPAARPE